MRIAFSPQRSDATLKVTKAGETLNINNKSFDFSVIPEGGILPAAGVDSDFVVGDVRREGGALKLTLLLPHGPDPAPEVSFPEPLINPPEGRLPLPGAATEE